MSIRVMTAVWDYGQGDTSAMLLQLALADPASDDGVSWPTIGELSRKSRLSERHVGRLLGEMVKDGRLQRRKVQRSRLRISAYRVNLPGLSPVETTRLPFVVDPPFDDMTPCHVVESLRHDTVSCRQDADPRVRESAAFLDLKSKSKTRSKSRSTSTAKVRKRTLRDDIWDALTAVCGLDTSTLTTAEKSRVAKSVTELVAVGATPAEVAARAARYKRKYRGAALTDRALANHWSGLGSPQGGQLGVYDR